MDETGYHGTCSKYRYSIEKDGFDPKRCKYRSDHWLGQGVYFFDDYDKAAWWAATVSSKNNNCGSIVYQADIQAPDDKVLDLDNNRQLDVFMTESIALLDEIKTNCKGNMPIFEESKIRAVFFDYYKQKNNISVIIRTFPKKFAGYTTKRVGYEKEAQNKLMNILKVQFQERQICVSDKECIKSVKLIYNEKEEVI